MNNEEIQTWECGCCGHSSKKEMKEFKIHPLNDRARDIKLCEICKNTYDPIVGVEYPNNLGSYDTFRILRTVAKIGMMILDRLDIIIEKMDRK